MASIGSEHAPRPVWRIVRPLGAKQIQGAQSRGGAALFTDGSDSSLIHRLAGAAFLIRVISAAITFVSQILLARWMGSFDFGIFIYGWTWLLLVGAMVDLGLGSSAQRFIPEYTEHKQFALLRGFLSGSRWLALLFGTIAGVAGALAVRSAEVAHRSGGRHSLYTFPAPRCRCSVFGRCRAASRAPTTGSISDCHPFTCSASSCCSG